MVSGMVPIASSLSTPAAARAALQSKWTGDGALGRLLSPGRLAWSVPECSVRLAALPFWRFEVENASATATVRAASTRGERGAGAAEPSGRPWRRVDVGSFGAGLSAAVEEVYAGYDLPPGVASIVLDGAAADEVLSPADDALEARPPPAGIEDTLPILQLRAAAVLVAGTTVGAGILALPTAAEESGFAASTAALAGGWLYCVATGLL